MNTYSVLTSRGEKIGRYTGNSPSQAGLKALRQIFKQTGKNPKHISIIKNGRDSDNKVYGYKTYVHELNEPKIRKIGGRTIEYKFEFKVERIN